MPGGPKLVHLTFNMDEGPKVKIRKIDFVGNKAISDGDAQKQMKENREQGRTDFIHSRWFISRSASTAPTRSEVRRGRGEGRRLLPRPGLRAARASASRS